MMDANNQSKHLLAGFAKFSEVPDSFDALRNTSKFFISAGFMGTLYNQYRACYNKKNLSWE